MMPLKLYFGPGACSFVPHSLLEIAQVDFEPQMVKLHKGEQYEQTFVQINPRSQVPVLVDGDSVITQILAIVLYLDTRLPEANFFPKEPKERAKAIELFAWMNNTVHPTFTHIFMPNKFTNNEAAQSEIKNFAKDPSKFNPAGSLRNEVNAYGALILGLDEERLITPELYEAMMNNEKVSYPTLYFTYIY